VSTNSAEHDMLEDQEREKGTPAAERVLRSGVCVVRVLCKLLPDASRKDISMRSCSRTVMCQGMTSASLLFILTYILEAAAHTTFMKMIEGEIWSGNEGLRDIVKLRLLSNSPCPEAHVLHVSARRALLLLASLLLQWIGTRPVKSVQHPETISMINNVAMYNLSCSILAASTDRLHAPSASPH
jgi:hypothetical protein